MTRPARVACHRQAAIVGIHALPFSKSIGVTERHAGGLAMRGAGLAVADVDPFGPLRPGEHDRDGDGAGAEMVPAVGLLVTLDEGVRLRFHDQAGTILPSRSLAD